jgi:hypothetical protein
MPKIHYRVGNNLNDKIMVWYPWYKFVIIGLIIVIVKSRQQNTKKKFKLNADNSDENKMNSTDVDVKSESIHLSTFEGSVYNLALNLIEELGFILVSKELSTAHDFEITFVNYEKKIFDFKRQSTYIKLSGKDNSKDISYTTWSDRYEFGQNSHNDEIAQEFLYKLNKKMS